MQKTRIECQGLGVPLILATACSVRYLSTTRDIRLPPYPLPDYCDRPFRQIEFCVAKIDMRSRNADRIYDYRQNLVFSKDLRKNSHRRESSKTLPLSQDISNGSMRCAHRLLRSPSSWHSSAAERDLIVKQKQKTQPNCSRRQDLKDLRYIRCL